jgi:hypothetical protein
MKLFSEGLAKTSPECGNAMRVLHNYAIVKTT